MKSKQSINKIVAVIICFLYLFLYVKNANCQISDIIPADRLPAEGTIAWESAGCNLLLSPIEYTEFIDVTEHGVVGDGSTYNWTAINQILSNLNDSVFTIVYFPSGNYKIEDRLVLQTNMVLKGAGSDSTNLEFDLISADNCIYVEDNNVGIEDLYIVREDTTGDSGDNIRFNNSENCWIRGVESYNPQRFHATITGTSSYIYLSQVVTFTMHRIMVVEDMDMVFVL